MFGTHGRRRRAGQLLVAATEIFDDGRGLADPTTLGVMLSGFGLLTRGLEIPESSL